MTALISFKIVQTENTIYFEMIADIPNDWYIISLWWKLQNFMMLSSTSEVNATLLSYKISLNTHDKRIDNSSWNS